MRVYRISEVSKPPTLVRHRSPTRSEPVRGQRHSRISVYRWSKIGPVARPRQYATTEGAEILRSGNSLPRRAIALSYSPRPCARSRKHRRPRLSMVENRSRRAPAPICVQASGRPKSRGPVTACAVAPSLSATLQQHAPARASTADPGYRWSKIGPRAVARPRQYACNDRGAEIPRSGNGQPHTGTEPQ